MQCSDAANLDYNYMSLQAVRKVRKQPNFRCGMTTHAAWYMYQWLALYWQHDTMCMLVKTGMARHTKSGGKCQ